MIVVIISDLFLPFLLSSYFPTFGIAMKYEILCDVKSCNTYNILNLFLMLIGILLHLFYFIFASFFFLSPGLIQV